MKLRFEVTLEFDEGMIDEASVSELFDSAVEDLYLDGITEVLYREV